MLAGNHCPLRGSPCALPQKASSRGITTPSLPKMNMYSLMISRWFTLGGSLNDLNGRTHPTRSARPPPGDHPATTGSEKFYTPNSAVI